MTSAKRSRRGQQGGFSLLEVMMALVVFVVAVAGMTAMQSHGLEAQRAAAEIRDAERVGQQVMADLRSRGFSELISQNFAGNAVTGIPDYADTNATRLLFDMRGPPADTSGGAIVRPGVREEFFAVHREVLPIPSNAASAAEVVGVQLVVLVMWVDTTTSNNPPPATATAASLVPGNVLPSDNAFANWARSVELRTVAMDNRGVAP